MPDDLTDEDWWYNRRGDPMTQDVYCEICERLSWRWVHQSENGRSVIPACARCRGAFVGTAYATGDGFERNSRKKEDPQQSIRDAWHDAVSILFHIDREIKNASGERTEPIHAGSNRRSEGPEIGQDQIARG